MMNVGAWMRAFDVIGGLLDVSRRARGLPSRQESLSAAGPGGALEARLAGVVVAALKEAFDRDSTRLNLEREQAEAERRRAERALQLELRRQTADHALTGIRLTWMTAFIIWLVSAVLLVWLPGMREIISKALLGSGWLLLIATLACGFVGQRAILEWVAEGVSPSSVSETPPRAPALVLMPWLLLAGLALTAVSLLVGM
jgi:hypothetical protein